MTIAEWLLDTMTKLGKAGVDSPRRDALVMLEDTLKKDRSWVLSHPEHSVQGPTLHRVNRMIERRVNREPLAYIRGRAWFYGRFFEVNPSVLIPRPESENFITLLKNLVRGPTSHTYGGGACTVVEVGTGSGCLAITAKLELPGCQVLATDIDRQALKVAQANAKKHETKINFLKGSLLDPLKSLGLDSYVIMANLPYVPEKLITSPEVKQEPALAIFSGEDGLDHYSEFWQQVGSLKIKPRYILTESLTTQHQALKKFARSAGYKLQKTDVLIQLFTNQD